MKVEVFKKMVGKLRSPTIFFGITGKIHIPIMLTVPDIIRTRQRRRNQKARSPSGRLRRWVFGIIVGGSLTFAFAMIGLALAYNAVTRDLPSLESLPVLLEPPDGALLKPTRIYDRTGEHVLQVLENPAASQRQYLRSDDGITNHLPETLVNATIAITGPTFWENPGYSLVDFTNPVPTTIVQKLVTDLLLWQELPNARRALRARLLAAQITQHFGREQVLEWYLNSANYGHLAYGADAAAWVYFGKSATDLTLAEAALLAGVSEAPDLNLIDTPEVAIKRQQQVLELMVDHGLISVQEAQQALDEPLHLQPSPSQTRSTNTVFINEVLEELATQLASERVARGGLKVITTLDLDLQQQTGCAIKTQLARLVDRESRATTVGDTTCETARLLPTLSLNVDDSDQNLSTDVAVIDPRTGQVLALMGVEASGQARPRLRLHAPGTLLTPYVYLTAFTRGFSPASLVWDIPANLPEPFTLVPNSDGKFHGPMRMRTALANDYVVPTLQILNQMGPENVWRTAGQLGLISLDVPAGIASQRLLVEGGQVSLLETVHAFSVFSNQGVLIGHTRTPTTDPKSAPPLHPTTLMRVEDRDGKVWLDFGSPESRPLLSAQLAYLITHILSDEAARWPSLGHPNPLEVGRPTGAKTAYTSDGRNGWTIGFIPQLVVGVWVGDDTDTALGRVSPNVAASIWHAIFQYATRELPAENWSVPAGITNIEVCDPSGLLPTPDCPTVINEIFIPGSEPTQLDTLYRTFQINRETGQLATVFTPPTLIDEQVFLVTPPEAVEWAQQAGLPTPPESYDLVSAPPNLSKDARITYPEMFVYVRGQVPIEGTASGDGFEVYRVQVGQGLNPQQWIQVGEESTTPLVDEELASWNTEGLRGLYAIRLLVVSEDQRIETAITQVTVDNQPPKTSIRYPSHQQQITYSQGETITLQVDASDDLALEGAEIYIDNHLITTLTQHPFAFPWEVTLGEHTLRVQVTDLAGNTAEDIIEFVVEH